MFWPCRRLELSWRTGVKNRLTSLYAKLTNWMQEQGLGCPSDLQARELSDIGAGLPVQPESLCLRQGNGKFSFDFRYAGQAAQTAPDFESVQSHGNPMEAAVDFYSSRVSVKSA